MTAPRVYGLLAEFPTPDALLEASAAVRDAGFRDWDAHAPFPLHGLNEAMGLKPTRLPWVVLGAGITGAAAGLLIQWATNAWDYPYMISGKPYWSVPANIPVTFELTILLSAIAAFVGMLAFNGLHRLHHPLFSRPAFARATADRFFISIEASDPRFDAERTETFLRGLHAVSVERVED